MNLGKLRKKLSRRQRGARRQDRKWRQSGERGHKRVRNAHRRAVKKLKALIERVQALYSTAAGFPYWGGSKRLLRERAAPVAARNQRARTSSKRWELFGNPGSDHYRGNKLNYAEDYEGEGWSEADNYRVAQEIRTAFDGGVHVDYEKFYVRFHGHTYRGQIIAAPHGTGRHIHVGVERVS